MIKRLKEKILLYYIKKICFKHEEHVLSMLFTEDDKYMIKRAIDQRRDSLVQISLTERWVDYDMASKDVEDYGKLSMKFSTDSWN